MLVKIIHEDTAGLSESYESLCREFDKLKKKILVIFEDIDRIYDKTIIQKLFAISEKISGKRLHVIFHYDMHVLKEQGFDRNYLEKYIPYTVNLTEIPYEKLVEYLWEDLGMSDMPLKMDDVRRICRSLTGLYKMNHLLGADISLNINLSDCISIRKVRIFLSNIFSIHTMKNFMWAKARCKVSDCFPAKKNIPFLKCLPNTANRKMKVRKKKPGVFRNLKM